MPKPTNINWTWQYRTTVRASTCTVNCICHETVNACHYFANDPGMTFYFLQFLGHYLLHRKQLNKTLRLFVPDHVQWQTIDYDYGRPYCMHTISCIFISIIQPIIACMHTISCIFISIIQPIIADKTWRAQIIICCFKIRWVQKCTYNRKASV